MEDPFDTFAWRCVGWGMFAVVVGFAAFMNLWAGQTMADLAPSAAALLVGVSAWVLSGRGGLVRRFGATLAARMSGPAVTLGAYRTLIFAGCVAVIEGSALVSIATGTGRVGATLVGSAILVSTLVPAFWNVDRRERFFRGPQSRRFVVAVSIGAAVALLAMRMMSSGLVSIATGGEEFAFAPLLLAHPLVMLGIGIREGEDFRCPKCDHQLGAPGERDSVPEPCPECGCYWSESGGLMRGAKRGDRRLIAAGLGLFALAVLVPFAGFFVRISGASSGLLTALPSGRLVAYAVSDPFPSDPVWNELISRTLAQSQIDELVAYQLQSSPPGGGIFHGEAWLRHAMSSGLLSGAQVYALSDRVFLHPPDDPAWQELCRMQLDPALVRKIATDILSKHNPGEMVFRSPADWVIAQTSTGDIPQDLLVRLAALRLSPSRTHHTLLLLPRPGNANITLWSEIAIETVTSAQGDWICDQFIREGLYLSGDPDAEIGFLAQLIHAELIDPHRVQQLHAKLERWERRELYEQLVQLDGGATGSDR